MEAAKRRTDLEPVFSAQGMSLAQTTEGLRYPFGLKGIQLMVQVWKKKAVTRRMMVHKLYIWVWVARSLLDKSQNKGLSDGCACMRMRVSK